MRKIFKWVGIAFATVLCFNGFNQANGMSTAKAATNIVAERESNNTKETAQTIKVGDTLQGTLKMVNYVQDNDYYAIKLEKGHVYSITWDEYKEFWGPKSFMIMDLVAPDGKKTYVNAYLDDNDTFRFVIGLRDYYAIGGTYYIHVHNEFRYSDKLYSFTVKELPNCKTTGVHETITISGKSATCTADGYSYSTKCVTCEKYVKAPTTYPAHGHSWSGKVTKEATDKALGVWEATCLYDKTHKTKEYFSLKTKTNPFGDVLESSWQFDAAKYAYDKGIMKGKGNTLYQKRIKFDPDGQITRAEFVQILYNLEKTPSVTYEKVFTDVKKDQWYTNAVIWAKKKGIASGKSSTLFDVSGQVTREEMAVMFMKYAAYKKYDVKSTTSLKKYSDAGKTSSWAVSSIKWAVKFGVMKGKQQSNGKLLLDPQGKATRAEAAAMFKNFNTAFSK